MPLQPMITGARYMISAGHYLATEAGHTVLSIGTAGVCAIVADREAGMLHGGADPRRAARAMGW